MSSIQPLGHKLPKALNLIHKDIKQLLNNPWYFISIVLTTSIHVSSEAENKNKKARQEISAPRLSLSVTTQFGPQRLDNISLSGSVVPRDQNTTIGLPVSAFFLRNFWRNLHLFSALSRQSSDSD